MLPKVVDSVTAVKWVGAVGAFNPLMYEDKFAKSQGMKGPIVHGLLKLAWLVHFATKWLGDEGTLKKISCEYRGIDYPRRTKMMSEPQEEETWLCNAKVTNKYVGGQDNFIVLEFWKLACKTAPAL